MNKRKFFKSIAKAAAIIALAPQLAFRVKPELPATQPFWFVEGSGIQVSMVCDLFKDGVKCGTVGWGRMPMEEHLEHIKTWEKEYQLYYRLLEMYADEHDMHPLIIRKNGYAV